MGGKNHAPCRKYQQNSTQLSLFLSLALANLENANVALERVILNELDGEKGNRSLINEYLNMSMQALESAVRICDNLEAQMRDSDYHDLPELKSLDLVSLGRALSEKGLVNQKSWEEAASLMVSSTFYQLLEKIRTGICALIDETVALSHRFEQIPSTLHYVEIMECNRPENIKTEFARLYTSWGTFNHFFMASTILSTEIWYAHMGYGTMLESHKIALIA